MIMQSIKINLENCYGINKLEHEFVFSDSAKTFSIYSSNGVMKTSFAKTFDDISLEKDSEDLVFTDRTTVREIQKDSQVLNPNEVFVIHPYEEKFHAERISTLLVNQKLKEKYEKNYLDINKAKSKLLSELKNLSGLNDAEIEKEISKAFMQNEESKFFEALEAMQPRIKKDSVQFEEIIYNKIFNENALAFLEASDAQANIKEYVEKYHDLIDQSVYFTKGIFNHSQAEDVSKQLEKNGFFKADHSVLLKGDQTKISTQKDLQKVIEDEKTKIITDPDLRKKFDVLDGKLIKNQNLRSFREYLLDNVLVLPELSNLTSFRAKLWVTYLKKHENLYASLLDTYHQAKRNIDEIIKQATAEKTEWLNVVKIFNQRFFVPFEIVVKNQVEVMLKNEVPALDFKFKDRKFRQSIEKDALLKVLSQGEKRALYILNIIFELEARKTNDQETLFIIDDIADSFDYKNKYAIIEYLFDISKESNFYQIILTHNFDFHRTISSRLFMKASNKLNALKTDNQIQLIEDKYHNNPFKNWISNLSDHRKLIASIPFARTLAGYSGETDISEKLTAFLHIKDSTQDSTIECLTQAIGNIVKIEGQNPEDKDKNFMSLLTETADSIVNENRENMELESKITLSIAIRLVAERFIINQQIDTTDIGRNQTRKLVQRYKEKYSQNSDQITVLEKVLLMTPESIHLNSFMYEPIIDMSANHLQDLYRDTLNLSNKKTETSNK